MSEEAKWIASRVFTDEHYGHALTGEEVAKMLLLEDEYKDEISMAKLMLEKNPQFIDLPYEKKLEVSSKLITELRNKKEENSAKTK